MSETKILNAICKCLQILANFKPPIVDNNGNAVVDVSGRQPPLHKDENGTPAKNIKEVYVKRLYVDINKEDSAAQPPPPVPRLAVFIKCLKQQLHCDFPMEPQQLVNGEFPTIGDLVFEIQQDCP